MKPQEAQPSAQSIFLWRNEMESAQRAHQRQAFERAKVHLDQAWQISGSFPENHPHKFETLLALGMVNFDLGNLDVAQEQLETTAQGYEALGSRYDRLRVSSLVGLALVSQRKANHGEAENRYLEAIDLMSAGYGPDHLSVAQTQANLAGLYLMLGRYDAAIPRLEHAVEVLQRDLGAKHPDSRTALQNLALAYRLKGDVAKAEELENRLSGQ